ncbi:chemotaxis protein CheC [Pseudogracilibacillus auburnensis]|uniref:Chemotaxis protein CheC n=1 Tax=Pseudogracilibacillus auburnensis TaxID=1494959 RepID=A0A2V3W3U3_9BACI|nr:chemotaxis protein CheC [Pseudogracilibacillus auburnensis]MBO1003784.1 chemotaxis protein CheC [Pseudogracilibacillus auburnensis]PXW88630.1 chemotaxis protein CheC [Pseudogracilibacillus auburnensis]
MKSKKLSDLQIDVLREIGNIGAGNATTSMSQLINKQVMMKVPSVKVVTINEMMDIIGGPEKLIVAIFFRIKGEITGTVYFVLTLKEAEYLVRQMTMNNELSILENGETDELAVSVLQEVANILTGSYLSALADFTQLNMKPTIPYLSIDMAAATLVTGLIELSQVTDYAIIIDTKITGNEEGEGAKGHFLLIPDPASIPELFSALGLNQHE